MIDKIRAQHPVDPVNPVKKTVLRSWSRKKSEVQRSVLNSITRYPITERRRRIITTTPTLNIINDDGSGTAETLKFAD